MPYTIAVNDIVEVTLKGEQDGQITLNLLHYRFQGSSPITDGDQGVSRLLTAIREDVTGWYKSLLENVAADWTAQLLRGQVIFPVRRAYFDSVTNEQGANLGDALPVNMQVSITKRTQLSGRGKTGRIEIAGIPISKVSNSVLVPGYINDLDDVGVGLKKTYSLAAGAETWQPIVFNRTAPASSAALDGFTVQDTIRVARRRTVRVGI